MAHVPDQVPHLHGVFGHEQNNGAVAIEGPWVQRSSSRGAGRLGMGAGNDDLHVACRVDHGRHRVAPILFSLASLFAQLLAASWSLQRIPSLALACGVLPLAVGEALGTPVLLAATRRYSTVAQRSISFSIIYMIMNVGYIAAGWIFDYVRQFNFHVTLFGFQPSSYQQLFMVSLVFEIVLFPVIYFLRRGAEATNGGPVIDQVSRSRDAAASFLSGIWQTVRQSAIAPRSFFGD